MGLFQGFNQREVNPTAQGLMGLGQQMMAAGAPTTNPNQQSGFAAGAQGFMQGYGDALQQNQMVQQNQADQQAVNQVFDPYTFQGMQDVGQPGLLGQIGNAMQQVPEWWSQNIAGQGNPGATMPAYGQQPGPSGMSGSF